MVPCFNGLHNANLRKILICVGEKIKECVREGKREREIKNEMVLDNRIKFYKINNRTAFRITVFYL